MRQRRARRKIGPGEVERELGVEFDRLWAKFRTHVAQLLETLGMDGEL